MDQLPDQGAGMNSWAKGIFAAAGLFAVVATAYHIAWVLAVYRYYKFPFADLLQIALQIVLLGAISTAALVGISLVVPDRIGLWLGIVAVAVYSLLALFFTFHTADNLPRISNRPVGQAVPDLCEYSQAQPDLPELNATK